MEYQEKGDRLQSSSLLSPAPSSPSSARTSSVSILPIARLHPLKPGSQKEISFINYVDSKILRINRRYAKKFSSERGEVGEEARGYDDFEDVVEDLDHVLDAIWVSRTRKPNPSSNSKYLCRLPHQDRTLTQDCYLEAGELFDFYSGTLQIPYLLSLAGLISDFLPAFPFVETPTVRLVNKMDQAFAVLLSQQRSLTAFTAGDGNDYLVSITDRVRIRSVIESTRMIAVEAASKKRVPVDLQDVSESFTDTQYEEVAGDDRSGQALDMTISKMYERSLSILGGGLG